jgi:hypothetical protein
MGLAPRTWLWRTRRSRKCCSGGQSLTLSICGRPSLSSHPARQTARVPAVCASGLAVKGGWWAQGGWGRATRQEHVAGRPRRPSLHACVARVRARVRACVWASGLEHPWPPFLVLPPCAAGRRACGRRRTIDPGEPCATHAARDRAPCLDTNPPPPPPYPNTHTHTHHPFPNGIPNGSCTNEHNNAALNSQTPPPPPLFVHPPSLLASPVTLRPHPCLCTHPP